MVLANRTRVQNSRTLLRAFGGLNEGYGCSEAEYSAGINFSSRDFPALSTRKPRRKLRTLTGLNGMYHLNGLLTVCGKDLVYTPDDGGETVTCTDAVADSKKALVGLGTKILIFPDKVAFDTAGGSVSALGACWKAEGQSVEFAPCDAEGRTYTPTGVGREEPESPADGQIFLKVEDEEHPWRYDGTLEVYSAASGAAAGLLPHHGGRCTGKILPVGHGDRAGHGGKAGRTVGSTGRGLRGVCRHGEQPVRACRPGG